MNLINQQNHRRIHNLIFITDVVMMKNKLHFLTTAVILSLLLLYSHSVCADDIDSGFVPQLPTSGQYVVNLPLDASTFTGEALTSIPIEIPSSAGNIEKKINLYLQYRSGGNNGWLGKGWELAVGYIIRINKFGANNVNNPYVLSLNGQTQELIFISGYQYRTKIESNMRIQFNGTIWQVWAKDGTEYKFEVYSGGRWGLTRVTDTHGIYLSIDYNMPLDELYLKSISYPQGMGLNPYCKIIFSNEARQDLPSSYYYGPASRITCRLKEIQVLVDSYIQKRYVLNYSSNGATNTSLLSSITEYGKDGKSLPPTKFSYQQPLTSGTLGTKEQWLADTGEYYTNQSSYSADFVSVPTGIDMAILDVNNDNLPDFVACKYSASVSSNPNKSEWVVRLNTGNGFSSVENTWLSLDNTSTGAPSGYRTGPITLTRNATLIDMNNDGLPDLVYSKYGGKELINSVYVGTNDIVVRYNLGNKFSDTETKLLDHTQNFYKLDNCVYSPKIGESSAIIDMNADGLPDFVYHKQRKWEQWTHYDSTCGSDIVSYPIYDLVVRLNTGSGFSNEEKIWLPKEKTYFKYSYTSTTGGSVKVCPSYVVEFICLNKNAAFIDMNGDGLVDLVYNDYAGITSRWIPNKYGSFTYNYPSYNWKIRYNTGEKFSDNEVTLLAGAPVFIYLINPADSPDAVRASSVRLGENGVLVDINNDGLPDLVYNKYLEGNQNNSHYYSINTPWIVQFNLGNSFGPPVQLYDSLNYSGVYSIYNNWFYNAVTHNSFLTDMNKDGTVDLVYPQFTYWYPATYNGKTNFKVMVCKNNGPISTDLLTSQISPYGGRTDLSYASSANFNNTGSDGKNGLSFIMPVVKTVIKNPVVGYPGKTTYGYEGGWYDLPNREFRGDSGILT